MHTSPLVQPGTGDSGGMNVYVRELAGSLARAGVPVEVFVRRWSAELADRVEGISVFARIEPVPNIAALAPAGLVIEAIVEQLEVKQRLFLKLEAVVAAETVLATNTSSLSITAIAAPLARPARVAGLHFFNPVPAMRLVEVVRGLETDPAVIDTATATVLAWGKEPIVVPSWPGFLVNRVARPFYAEPLRLVQEGAADPATVDTIMREAGGFRMGPFELIDLIGLDVNLAVTRSVFEATHGDRRYAPSWLQEERVRAGLLGRKTGRGFFRYGDTLPPSTPAVCSGPTTRSRTAATASRRSTAD